MRGYGAKDTYLSQFLAHRKNFPTIDNNIEEHFPSHFVYLKNLFDLA